MRHPKLHLPVAPLLLLAGCSSQLPIEATVTSMNEEGVRFHIVSEPGVTAYCMGREAEVGDDGTVDLLVPIDAFPDGTYAQVNVSVHTEHLFGAMTGYGDVRLTLPMAPADAAHLPAAGGGAFVRIATAGHRIDSRFSTFSGRITGELGEGFVSLDGEGVASIRFVASPGGTLRVGDREATVDATGTATFSRPLGELVGSMSSGQLMQSEPTVTLPVHVEHGGESADQTLTIRFDATLRTALADLAGHGALFGADHDGGAALLYLGYDGPMWLGPEGTLADAGRVVVGTARPPREGPACTGYGTTLFGGNTSIPRSYVDVELVVLDPTGQELERQTIQGGGDGCPATVSEGRTIQDGPGAARIRGVLEQLTPR
ncbi:MAG: hypothetical protein R3B82_19830 [Sandaracinaceae bacterium]